MSSLGRREVGLLGHGIASWLSGEVGQPRVRGSGTGVRRARIVESRNIVEREGRVSTSMMVMGSCGD